MIDSVLGFTPQNKQSFYFMLLVDRITLGDDTLCSQPHNLKFLLFKGIQIFNQTKDPISINFQPHQEAKIEKVQLTFFLKDYNPNRKNDFVLKLREVSGEGQENQIGSHCIFANNYINALKQDGQAVIEETIEAGPYSVRFKIFTDKNRYDLEKLVKNSRETESRREQAYPPQKQATEDLSKKQQEKPSKQVNNLQLNIKRNIDQIKNRDGPKPRQQVKNTQIPTSPKSPDLGVKNTFAKAPKPMRNSQKLEKSDHQEVSPQSQNPLNLKIIIFLVLSLVVIIFAMTPTRKAPGKKSGHL